MARGQRLTTDDKIARLRERLVEVDDKKQSSIRKYDEEIKQIKSEIADLLEEQKAAKKEELFEKVEASGKTIDEILAAISE